MTKKLETQPLNSFTKFSICKKKKTQKEEELKHKIYYNKKFTKNKHYSQLN